MVVYEHLHELDSAAEDRLRDVLLVDEEFVVAFKNTGLFAWLFPYFVVTDRRFIRFRKIWVWEYLSDIHFERLSNVEYRTVGGGITGELELEGNGISELFSFRRDPGRRLADAVRTQLAERNESA